MTICLNWCSFYIDEVPIREVLRSEEMGGEYPSKPMSLYSTIWDASNWATSGGKYKVNYKYAPFVTEFKDLVLKGCAADPIQEIFNLDGCADQHADLEAQDYAAITPTRRLSMRRFRQRYMYYSYCYDTLRYNVPPPECVIVPSEKQRFKETGRLRFGGSHRRQSRRKGRTTTTAVDSDEGDMWLLICWDVYNSVHFLWLYYLWVFWDYIYLLRGINKVVIISSFYFF